MSKSLQFSKKFLCNVLPKTQMYPVGSLIAAKDFGTSSQLYQKQLKEEVKVKDDTKEILGFDNPTNLLEKVLFGLNLHKIPSVVSVRQVNTIYFTCIEVLEKNKDFFFKECGLPDNFQTWFSLGQLHIWIAMVRIRAETDGRKVNQNLVNRFFNGVEFHIRDCGVNSERIVAKTAKSLIEAFRGGNLAYDEGICKSDAVLAAALWRNLFTTADGSIKGKQITYMVRYVRQQLKHVDGISSNYVFNGLITFTKPEAKI
ncbi:Serine carboxypeptidase 3 [Entomophthora muscae]|uniref:Serine carboxypeptidase 3 n=1 Tax=Entomophthora muscae TaxID=34485 RepID=A0ACC2RFA3_9FUNG|nr:Serine carboxypeptidase 3 [Entomophthora muscae]